MQLLWWLLLSLSVASGCTTTATSKQWVPGVIIDPDEASQASLQGTLKQLFGRDVLIASDALTNSSILSIERSAPQRLNHPATMGRIMTPPIQLKLMTDGVSCILFDQRFDKRHVLAHTKCVPQLQSSN